jgi:hypothetical protein
LERLKNDLHNLKDIMKENIDMVLDRGKNLEGKEINYLKLFLKS